MTKEKNIDILLEILTNGIKLIEQQLEKKKYSKSLLDYIQYTERKSKQLLYQGHIIPSNDDIIAGKQLLLVEVIEYIMIMFPTYSIEVRDNLILKENTHATTAKDLKLTEIQKQILINILSPINEHIAKDSSLDQWTNLFTKQKVYPPIEITCKHKILAEFITKLRFILNLDLPATYFQKCEGFYSFHTKRIINGRFMESGTRDRIIPKNHEILNKIFKAIETVQK